MIHSYFSHLKRDIKPTPAYENKGAALLAKMGYDGGGLGKSGQGRTELIPFSTHRGREGLGQPTNQVELIFFSQLHKKLTMVY